MSNGEAVPGPGSGSVLVVDDNGVNRFMLSQHVNRLGHAVTTAEDGPRALELLRSSPFDLVLLDVMMPGMSGHDVLQTIKSDPALRGIPVIMVSGLDEIDSVARCIEGGAEDYLPKPIDSILLRARINASLEKKWLRDEEVRKTEELSKALDELASAHNKLVTQEKLAFLGSMSAGIAHEIKNPLNFVTNFAQLMLELLKELRGELEGVKDKLGDDVWDNVEDILGHLDLNAAKVNEHGQRADNIVRGMLLLSRGGISKPHRSNVNAILAQSVDLAFHGLRAQDQSFNITIHVDFDKSIQPMLIVPQDLSRAFLNVANNACYAAHERRRSLAPHVEFTPSIWASSTRVGDDVEIRIRDNGSGIPPEIVDQVFNPFFTTKPAGVGTGLGLSIVHGIIVEEHKGDIRVETKSGEFTEVVITLPYITEEPTVQGLMDDDDDE